jgi:hypothetical protein
MNNTWYVSKTSNDQGLIVDEKTGANIAVSYEKVNAQLISSAPDLLEACEQAATELQCFNCDETSDEDLAILKILNAAIAKAKGE